MQILKQIARSLSARSAGPILPTPPNARAWLRGEETDVAQGKLAHPYTQSAWIYVAVTVLADNLAQVPFRISRGQNRGEDLVESGPVVELFEHPHPAMSRALFWQTLVSWEALRGEFFIVALDGGGRPVSLPGIGAKAGVERILPLHPDCFAHIVEGYELAGWRFSGIKQMSPLEERVLLAEEVIHSRNFNPYLFWRGLSPLTVALLPAASDYAAEQFMKGLMVNNADAGLIITSKDVLGPEQREQMLATINERKRRAGTADRPLFLWGELAVQQPTISSVDLQFLENRKLNRQEIGAIFKVPESMMGFAGQKSALSAGTAIEQDRLLFIESTIAGLCRRLEAAVDPIVKSFGRDLYGWFDLEALPILQEARRNRMLTAEKAFGMGVPFNEINEVYDLGFRSLPWGDRGYVPGSMVEIGRLAKKSDGDLPTEGTREGAVERMLGMIDRARQAQEQAEAQASADTGANASATSTAATMALIKSGKLRRFLFEQRGRVLEKLKEFGDGSFEGCPLDLKTENALLWEMMAPLVQADGEGEADEEHLAKLGLEGINQGTATALANALIEGRLAGENASSLAERVKRVFQKTSKALQKALWLQGCEGSRE